jgi:hypothetical protein
MEQGAIPSYYNELQDQYGELRDSVRDGMNDYANRAYVGVESTADFLNSNAIVAKFAFLFLVLIAFMILFSLGINLVGWLFSRSTSPYILYGTQGGSMATSITQDPLQSNSVVVYRSNNATSGIEFTWSVWLYVQTIPSADSSPSATQTYSHIFNKGNAKYDATGIATVNNGPGMYVCDMNNSLHFIMNVENDTANNSLNVVVDIPNIPMGKWFHVALRLQNKIMDTYINGVITTRSTFIGVPKQNYDNIQICQNNGFAGSLSNLRYYSYALSVNEINMIVYNGPNLKSAIDHSSMHNYSYLSNQWYVSNYT